MSTNEIYEQMAELFTEFSLEHSKTSKAAHGRARSALTKIKKLITHIKFKHACPVLNYGCNRCIGCTM